MRRATLTVALTALLAVLAPTAAAQSYPSKPLRIIVFTGVPPVIPLMQAGKLRLMATTGGKRIATIPDLPTIAEAGYPGAAMGIWYGLVAPAATPKDILARLHREITRIQTLPDIRERFVQLGTEPTTSTPEQFTALVRDELAKWGKVIKAAGVKVE